MLHNGDKCVFLRVIAPTMGNMGLFGTSLSGINGYFLTLMTRTGLPCALSLPILPNMPE